MLRDASIPLFLWIATAIVAHLIWGGGADRTAKLLKETRQIQSFAEGVRQSAGYGGPTELTFVNLPDEDATELTIELPKPKPKAKPAAEPEPKPEIAKLETPKPPEPEKKPEDKKKAEETKPIVVVPAPERRIAVRQHPTDERDNPDARFIADKANRVKEEMQARITSTDRDDQNPTPGHNAAGPRETQGDSEENRAGQSEDHEGEQRAPTEDKQQKVARLDSKAASRAERSEDQAARDARVAREAAEARIREPDVVSSKDGTWTTGNEAERAQAAARAERERRALLPHKKRRSPWAVFGLDSEGTTANGVNLNLTSAVALQAIGREQIAKDRRRDAEQRRSKHRGSWKSSGLERWRSAIENYVPSVKPGNTTALNAAAVPFANYLNTIHNRLHPIFADTFLGSLDGLPDSNPLSRMDMSTNLEIVVSPDEGRIVRMGVTKTSGVTAFDVAALESVSRAQPFGAPPKEIISPDGNVYLHWEFYRNPDYACSTYFARPFMLRAKPETAPPAIAPPPIPPAGDEPPDRDRHGEIPRDRSGVHALR